MDYKELIQQILYVVATCILPILTVYITSFLKSKVKEVSAKIDNDTLQEYINTAYDAIEKSVLAVNQTYVDSLKKSGKFDKDAQEQAKQMAIEQAKLLITDEAKQAVEVFYNDFNAYLESCIESIVRDSKVDLSE
jgi:hypothetical protein